MDFSNIHAQEVVKFTEQHFNIDIEKPPKLDFYERHQAQRNTSTKWSHAVIAYGLNVVAADLYRLQCSILPLFARCRDERGCLPAEDDEVRLDHVYQEVENFLGKVTPRFSGHSVPWCWRVLAIKWFVKRCLKAARFQLGSTHFDFDGNMTRLGEERWGPMLGDRDQVLAGNQDVVDDSVNTHQQLQLSQKLWAEAETLQEVFRLNRAFLRGEIYSSPYHIAPIEAETRGLVDNLLRLHDYGIFTHDGQPMEETQPTNEGKEWKQYRQLPRLDLALPQQNGITASQEQLRALSESLLTNDKCYASVSCPVRQKRTEYREIDYEWDTKSSIPETGNSVYYEKTAETVQQLIRAQWVRDGDYPPQEEDLEALEYLPKCFLECKPILVTLKGRSWEEPVDLERLVEQLALKAGMDRRLRDT